MTNLYNKLNIKDNRLYLEKGTRTLVHENILHKYRVKETVYFRNNEPHRYVISTDEYDELFGINVENILGAVEFHEQLKMYIFYADSRTHAFTDRDLMDIANIVTHINMDYINAKTYEDDKVSE